MEKKETFESGNELSSSCSSGWSVKTTTSKPMAVERWNVQKQQRQMNASLMEYYEKQLQACKLSEHNLNKKAESLYNKIFSDLKWSYPPIANVHANLILEYCRHLITNGSYQPFPKEMDLRSWNVKVKGTKQEKGVDKMKEMYTRLFRLISRRDNMVTSANNTLMLSSEKIKIKNEGNLRWMMEQNDGKKDEYFSIWNLSKLNKLRELQVLFSSKNKMKDYGDDGVNCVDPDFCLTALHYACKEAHFEIIQFLLQQGADVNIAAPDGRTPLHFAAAYSNREIVLALLGAGSIATARDNNENTPLDLARRNQNKKTLPTLQHWEDLMGFKGEEDDDAILMSLQASANLNDASQGLQENAKSLLLKVDEVDKLPDMSRSFVFDYSRQIQSKSFDKDHFMPSTMSRPTSKWKDDLLQSNDNVTSVPWEYATVSSGDFQRMSRDLQFLVQRLNGYNPYLIKRQQQLLEQQQQMFQSQILNPNYQQQLYMSQTNWPAVTSNMMHTHSFAWNSSMVSLPYNPSLHVGSQSILAANFGHKTNSFREMDDDSVSLVENLFQNTSNVSTRFSLMLEKSTSQDNGNNDKVLPPQEKILFPSRRAMKTPIDDEQLKIDKELEALGMSYAGDKDWNNFCSYDNQNDKEEIRNKYLTEIRLCTKYFILCTKEGFTSEAVRILHRRWTAAKKLYEVVAIPRTEINSQQNPFSQLQSPVSHSNPKVFSPHQHRELRPRDNVITSPLSFIDHVDNTTQDEAICQSNYYDENNPHKIDSEIIEQICDPGVVNGSANNAGQDDDAASAVSAMTADFDESVDGPHHPHKAQSTKNQEPVNADSSLLSNVHQEPYDGSRDPVHLEKLASDFLRTFTIIEYLPSTPGANDIGENKQLGVLPEETGRLPAVERISNKIFIETEEAKNEENSTPYNNKGDLVVDSENINKLQPKDIIQNLLRRYANEEHRLRLMEYAWRYENQELLDHYTVHSSTAAASQSLSSAMSADRRYRERLAQKYASGSLVSPGLGLGGGLGPQPTIPIPDTSQVHFSDPTLGLQNASIFSLANNPGLSSPAGKGESSIVFHLTAPSMQQAFHHPQMGFISASQLANHRRAHNIGIATNLLGDENSTIVSLASWDLSIQRHYQQHPPPIYLPDNNYMTPFFPLTDLEKYAENYVLMLGMEFVEVLLVQKEYDQALLCLEDCLRLHDGVLITMRIRVIFQLCDLILFLCDSCWQLEKSGPSKGTDKNIESSFTEDSEDSLDNDDEFNEEPSQFAPRMSSDNIMNERSVHQHHKKGEAAFSPYTSSVLPPSFSTSVISNKTSSKIQNRHQYPQSTVLSSSTTQLPPIINSTVSASLTSKSVPNTPTETRNCYRQKNCQANRSSTTGSAKKVNDASKNEELDPAKWLSKTLGAPSSLASNSKKKKKQQSSQEEANASRGFLTPICTDSNVSSTKRQLLTSMIHLNLSSKNSGSMRLSTLPAIDAKVVHTMVTGPKKRRRKEHVLQAQQSHWPEKLKAIEEQWDTLRSMPSLSLRDTLQSHKSFIAESDPIQSNFAIIQDPLYRKLLKRCLMIAQEAIDLGSVLSSRHVFEPLFIAQAMGYLGLAQEKLGDIQEAWEMLEQASLVAGRVAYASTTAIELMLDSLRIYVKYQCRTETHLTWVSKKAAEINQMIAVYSSVHGGNDKMDEATANDANKTADRWWRKSAECLAIATMTVRDPYYRIDGHEQENVRFEDKSMAETLATTKRKIRYL